jgi:hypothetical protein
MSLEDELKALRTTRPEPEDTLAALRTLWNR